MKTRSLLVFFVIAVAFISCSVAKYTHTEVMDIQVLNQSKYGILSQFGNPTQTRGLDSNEVWIYNYVQAVKMRGKRPSDQEVISSSGGGSLASSFDRYLAVTFRNGRVIKWETKGVDFSVKAGGGSGGGSAISILLGLYVIAMAVGLPVLLGTK